MSRTIIIPLRKSERYGEMWSWGNVEIRLISIIDLHLIDGNSYRKLNILLKLPVTAMQPAKRLCVGAC